MKNKLFSKFLCFLMCFTFIGITVPITGAAENIIFDGGDGSVENPYMVSTPEQLNEVRNFLDKSFIQTADINLSAATSDGGIYYNDGAGWDSIGDEESWKVFTGTYNGNNHKIIGMNINQNIIQADSNSHFFVGLFEIISGTVENLVIDKGSINIECGTSEYGTIHIGAVCGTNLGKIQNCGSTSNIKTTGGKIVNAGGIAGDTEESKLEIGVDNCFNSGNISGQGCSLLSVGGIFGSGNNTIVNCYNSGHLNGLSSGGISVGGIVGFMEAEVKNCYNIGDISSDTGSCGGIVGSSLESKDIYGNIKFDVVNCFNTGNISGESVGGIIGTAYEERLDHYTTCFWNSDSKQIENGIELSTEEKKGVNYIGGWEDSAKAKTSEEIKSNEFIELINKGNEGNKPWRFDATGSNGGYPVFADRYKIYSSVDEGVYEQKIYVKLSSEFDIYYTTDGTVPTNKSVRYTGPIEIDGFVTLKYIGICGDETTDVYTQQYRRTIRISSDTEPGLYNDIQNVTLTSNTPDSVIYYTTDGTAPNKESMVYTTPIEIYKPTVLQAVAIKGEYSSEIVSYEYDFPKPIVVADLASGTYTNIKEVALSSNLSDAKIYYTMDGTVPTEASMLYTSPIEIYKSTILKAIAVRKDYSGRVTSFTYNVPELYVSSSLKSGNYEEVKSASLTASLPESEIYYTLDGADPRVSGIIYTSPIEISETITLKTVAKRRNSWGEISTYNYTFPVLTVIADTVSGFYDSSKTISLSSNTYDGEIYFTLDGTEPSEGGIKYADPILLYKSSTLKAAVVRNGYWGKTVTYEYTFPKLSVNASIESGLYGEPITVILSSDLLDAEIYYTSDGSDPRVSGTKYTIPIRIANYTQLKTAAVINNEWTDVKNYEYNIYKLEVKASVDSGMYEDMQLVELSASAADAEIYYTINGADPSISGIKYTEPIKLYTSSVLKAVAVKDGLWCNTITCEYTFPELMVSSDHIYNYFDPDGNESVELICSTNDSSIYYTLDKSDPLKNGILYTDPIPLNHDVTIKAVAVKNDLKGSISSYTYYSFGRSKALPIDNHYQDNMKIAQGEFEAYYLKENGTVSIGLADDLGWRMISDITAGRGHVVGLEADGTVIAKGDNSENQCEVSGWNNIVLISAGAWHTSALMQDGTVISTIPGKYNFGQSNTDGWKNIICISAGAYHTVGLKQDGTVTAVGDNSRGQCKVEQWKDIVDISSGSTFTAGLKKDGTVVCTNDIDVSSFKNIVKIYAQGSRIIGIDQAGSIISSDNSTQDKDIIEFAYGYVDSSIGIYDSGETTTFIRLNNGTTVNNNYPSGKYNSSIKITLEPVDERYEIYYTVDGADPKLFGFRYLEPVELTDDTRLRIVTKLHDSDYCNEVIYDYIVDNSTVHINSVKNQNDDNITISNLLQTQEININISNNKSVSTDAVVIAAIFDANNHLIKSVIEDVALDLDMQDISVKMQDSIPESAVSMKVFIWDKNQSEYSRPAIIN